MKRIFIGLLITVMFSSCDFLLQKDVEMADSSITETHVYLDEPPYLLVADTIADLDSVETLDFIVEVSNTIPMYNIIIGSFKNPDLASQFATKHNAEVMPISSSGFYRVSKERFDNRYDALLYMEGYQFTDSAVWIFKDVIQ